MANYYPLLKQGVEIAQERQIYTARESAQRLANVFACEIILNGGREYGEEKYLPESPSSAKVIPMTRNAWRKALVSSPQFKAERAKRIAQEKLEGLQAWAGSKKLLAQIHAEVAPVLESLREKEMAVENLC